MTEHQSSWSMVPATDEALAQVVVETCSKCFDVDAAVELYAERHSREFGWYEGGTRINLPRLNNASRDNLRMLLQGIRRHFVAVHGCRLPEVAYMLATARVEAYDFRKGVFFSPIAEIISEEAAEIAYGVGSTARRPRTARSMGNEEPGDGYRYRGRGLVQITWKRNYQVFGDLLGLDLVAEPELAAEWPVAIRIMVEGMVHGLFTGKRLSDYITGERTDFVGARRIINGLDRAEIIAEYAAGFLALLEEAGCAGC